MYKFSVVPFGRFNQFLVGAVASLLLLLFLHSRLLYYSLSVKLNIHKMCEYAIRCRGLVSISHSLFHTTKPTLYMFFVRAAYFMCIRA